MMHNRSHLFIVALGCGLVFFPPPASVLSRRATRPQRSRLRRSPRPRIREQAKKWTRSSASAPTRRRLPPKRRSARRFKGAYKTWLEQDVPYIITDEERRAFKALGNDEEREAFIEQFWLRRNPNPDSPENEFREEHYRRIAYANEHFAAGKPGWKTDRGHIYINFGKPDSIDSHPSGGMYERPYGRGRRRNRNLPLRGLALPVSGGHRRERRPGVCRYLPVRRLPLHHRPRREGRADARSQRRPDPVRKQMGQAKKADRFKGGLENLGTGPMRRTQQAKQFDRIELAAKIFAPPPVKFTDLDAFISEHKLLSGPVFPFDVRTDFVKVTESTVLVPITLQIKNRDITFVTKDGVSKGVVNILGKVTTLTHKTVQTFEDTVEVEQPAELLEKSLDRESVYWKALPLLPGLYRLDIAIKDVNNPDHVGIYGRSLEVPTYHDEKLGTSSLILADQMNTVSSREIGSGNFVIGNTHICPRVSPNAATPVSFKRSQQLNFWMQVYNLGIDEATKSNQATVTYQITDTATDTVVFEKQLESKDLGAHSDQLTVEKTLPMAGLQPGKYKVTIKVNDTISKQEIAQSAPFVVE